METPEQYTVKTLEEIKEQVAKKNGFDDWADLQLTWLERVGRKLVVHENYIDQVAKLWNAELIKENERLREENKLYREALTELKRFASSLSRLADDHLQYPVNCNRALANIETVLSKFQPKKDEPDPRDSGLDDSWIHDVEMGAR